MKPNNQNPKNEYQEILKKIEAQSKQKKQERTLNIMRGQTSKNKSYQSVNIFNAFKNYLMTWRIQLGKYIRIKQNRHTAIMTVFLLFSSYIAWSIEKKYDRLRKKAQRTQTFKQRQVQKQNQYIEKMLKKKQFEPVPIPLELQEENSYKFQESRGRAGLVIDTKQDLMDLISKDKIGKRSAQEIYQEEVKKAKQRI